jgi:hypothetical protein
VPYLVVESLGKLSTVGMCPVVAAASVGWVLFFAACGLSTCAAFSRGQNLSLWLAEGRRRLIWWSRTLDTLATVGMCPVVAAASVGWVLLFATCGLSTCAAFSRSQDLSFWLAEGRLCLIWWSRTLDKLSTVEMCPVVAAASVVRVLACRGFTSGAVKRSQVALVYPAFPARLGTGAGRVHRTFAVIAALSRVCIDQISRTTTLAKIKRQVLISGKRSAGRKTKAAPVRSARRLTAAPGEPSESQDPLHGRSGDHRAHSDG